MSKNRIALLISSAVAIAAVVLIISIPGARKPIKVNSEFRNYVSAFTSGIISKDSKIRVELQNPVADSSMIGEQVQTELFKFSPKVNGKAYWIDKHTVEFRPEEMLEHDELYNVEFFLSNVIQDIEKEFETMEFSFRTLKQSMEFRLGHMKFLQGKQIKWLKLSGQILTADIESLDALKEIVEAQQDNKDLEIRWTQGEQPTIFNFTIDSIQRKDESSSVTVEWNGKEIGVDKKGEEKIDVTESGKFILRKHSVKQGSDQSITLEFSDPLATNQDLRGLISIGKTGSQFVIDQNIVKIYPEKKLTGKVILQINRGIKNILGKKFPQTIKKEIEFENIKPKIRFNGKGVILPSTNNMILPFQAVNLKAVDLTIYQIYENNILQFLQENELDEYGELSRVAKVIYKGSIPLNSAKNAVTDYSNWNDFAIDLSKFIEPSPGAIYRVRMNIKKEYSTYPCDGKTNSGDISFNTEQTEEVEEPDYDKWEYRKLYRNRGEHPEDYNWRERDNPCNGTYYYRKYYARNILASDLGLLAKRGNDNKNLIYVTDLVTAEPLSGVELEVYNYQQQIIKRLKTGSDGSAEFKSQRKPFVVVAKRDNERGYLKMNDGLSNSLSKFDVSGRSPDKGLNGFIYGERGVWRPGDTLFISFMLEDKLNKIPENVPAVCKFYSPRGQLSQKLVSSNPEDFVYNFKLKTSQDDPSGRWKIKISVGDAEFTKYVRIETIKPNRLKIQMNFKEERIKRWDIRPIELDVEWLHGGTASNLEVKSEVTLRKAKAEFDGFEEYSFSDPAKPFSRETYTVFDGRLDKTGKASVLPDFNLKNTAPGVLSAHFETRVFERSGNSNIHSQKIPFYPYRSYAGIKTKQGASWHEPLKTGKTNTIELCNLTADGKKLNSNNLKIKVFKLSHSWWYDYSGNRLERLLNDKYSSPYASGRVHVRNGKATYKLRINKPDHGRYYIRARDMSSGHTAGRLVYVSGYNWRSSQTNKDFASLLIFESDKEKYETGEEVKLKIPSSANAKILVSLESGLSVIKSEWIDAKEGETVYTFKTNKEMAPTVYAHVTLLQPHAQTKNDLPLRLYGVIPINVEEEESKLYPEIICASSFRPESNATIKVREKNGRPMTYTLAVVDEGLLDLTGFQTPDPWNYFYQRKALGVKTWDIFDYVIGAFGGEINRILSVGGGGGLVEIDNDKAKVNRFKPMVRYLGPFKLNAGKTKTHSVDIPQYIGRVRVMAVARKNDAYGNDEKSVKVKSPLMVLGTLPRVLSPNEEVELPVNVFAMEDDVRNVNVTIDASDIFEVKGSPQQRITFDKNGNKLARFKLKAKQAIGAGKVKIKARSNGHIANYTIDIKVENPNPVITQTSSQLIRNEKSASFRYIPPGMKGTNKAFVEVSAIPPIDLSRRVEHLIRYPYGCLEQTVSSVFPQIFLSSFTQLDQTKQKDINRNVKAGINTIRKMQLYNGSFSYWPGRGSSSEWGTSYAGHFLMEAREKGYTIPGIVMDKWFSYQKQTANRWDYHHSNRYHRDLVQAYRLYTLAAYGNPAIGAMNRLKEVSGLDPAAQWMLAAAYARAGQKALAKQLLSNAPQHIEEYTEYSYTFGSKTRDYAIMVEALTRAGQSAKAFNYIRDISKELSSSKWLSTQTIAFSLVSINTYLEENNVSDQMEFNIQYGDQHKHVKQKKPFYQLKLEADKRQDIEINNESGANLYSRLIKMGKPLENTIKSKQNNLYIRVNYKNMDGESIDPQSLEQGTDFIGEVTIRHPGTLEDFKELALEQVFPSGWEITGMRLQNSSGRDLGSSGYDYQDVRDDRVFTFFDLKKHKDKTYRVMLNAAYIGHYYHPVIQCKAMYSDQINAYKSGYWVRVVKP